MPRETETKIELTATSFEKLLTLWPVVSCIDQLNVYYDDRGRIAARSGSFRIRYVCDAAPVVTLKVSVERAGGRRVSEELEAPLRGRWLPPPRLAVMRDLDPLFHPVLGSWRIERLQRIGGMRTMRTLMRLPSGADVELDRVSLPDGTLFFEAEIESEDAVAHAAAVAAVQAAAPDWRFSTMGKFHRFVRGRRPG